MRRKQCLEIMCVSLFEDTNPRELKELLRLVHTREAVLPDFQRDFVWEPGATQELIISIAQNYPAGSLLRIRNTYNLFACRSFEGAAPLDSAQQPTFLVLDGQQRLTSLYQAFYGVGEHRYFLHLRKLLEGADIEEAIFHLRTTARRAQQLAQFDTQATELILPLSVLKGGSGGFLQWVLQVTNPMKPEERTKVLDQLTQLNERWVQTIDDYRFPVVTLSDGTSAEAVCTIFETLNRTGVKLSPFELLTARFWHQGVNLRSLWEQAKIDHPIIGDFQIDPYYVLQIVSLVSRRTASCKRSDVLGLKAEMIEEWWGRAVRGLAHALEILRDDCGVIVPRWLPYHTIVIPLAAVLARLETPGTPQAAAHRQKLTRWFWCAVFGQAYENAPNSQAAKDLTELLAWLGGDREPETVREFRFDPRVLLDTTVRQRGLYRGVICLLLRRDPRDFYNGAKITGDLIIEQHIDDHHVFPQAFLGSAVPSRLRDCVLNRTLIDRKTNIRISNQSPAKYMKAIRKALGDGPFAALLESHLLPGGESSSLWANDFEAFLTWRQAAVWKEIQLATGIQDTTEILAATATEVAPQSAREDVILIPAALRFDGWKYLRDHQTEGDTSRYFEEPIQEFFRSGEWPEDSLEQLAAFFGLQRGLYKWGLEYEPRDGRYWQAFRSLFLLTAEYDVTERYRHAEYWPQWEREVLPRLSACMGLIRDVHQSTRYQVQDEPVGELRDEAAP